MRKIITLLIVFLVHNSYGQNLTIDIDNGLITIKFINVTFDYSKGSDGRVVCYPAHWTTASGSDGRIVAYPSGWTWESGSDGRKVVRPSSGWTWESGSDGRKVVRPSSGWTWESGSDGRKVVRPNGSSSNLEFIFINAEYLAIFEELKSQMSEEELINYLLYVWINIDKDE